MSQLARPARIARCCTQIRNVDLVDPASLLMTISAGPLSGATRFPPSPPCRCPRALDSGGSDRDLVAAPRADWPRPYAGMVLRVDGA